MIVLAAGPDALARLMRDSAEARLRDDRGDVSEDLKRRARADTTGPVVRLMAGRSR